MSMSVPAIKAFCFNATKLVIVPTKFASSPIASAISLSVSNNAGALFVKSAIALPTAKSAYSSASAKAFAAEPAGS